MEQDKKVMLLIILGLMVVASFLSILAIHKNEEEPIIKSDAIKFKEEYESYNGKINNAKSYPIVDIKEDNPMVYKTDDEIVKVLENGTGIIYFGFSTCPWCRSMLPMLLKAAENTNVSEILYVDVKEIRSQLTLGDQDEVVVKEKGTNGYYEILKQLDEVLEPYYLENKNGEKIDTKEKRLYAPTVVTIKDGKVLDIHVGTVKTQKSGYDDLSSQEQEEIYNIYQKMILKLTDTACDDAC